jgi:hypothetical protein
MSDLEKELTQVIEEEEQENERSGSDNDNEDSYNDDSESEFEEIDVTDNPLYQVLSAFFETEEGENICDILKDINESVRENTRALNKLMRVRK